MVGGFDTIHVNIRVKILRSIILDYVSRVYGISKGSDECF